MPYCSQCGNQVGPEDAYCARCGFRQPAAGPLPNAAPGYPPHAYAQPAFQQSAVQSIEPLANIPSRTFAILCYIPVLGWVPSVIVLAMKRFRGDVKMRFHAFQGLYIFAAWLIVDWAIHPIFESMHHVFRVDSILEALLMVVWVFMLVKTSQGQTYELPLVGELAQRSAREKT
jgi:uncharacterized membrane protein